VGAVWLLWPQRSALQPPEIKQAKIVRRLEFYGYDRQSDTLHNLRRQLPEGYFIRALDRPLLERCAWRDEMAFYAGSLESFLAHGMGNCMLRGDEIVVEAYASALGNGLAEIGAITHEAARGRGFAPIACAFLIEGCEQRGYQAYWSCEADNQASIRVAQKLGFQQESGYIIYEYEAL
jgi:RimJ/RimL family protein N-acetyltransferase